MKLTQEIIDKIQEAMLHTKKDGSVNWKDGDEIEVNLAGTFAADRFIVIKNKTKDPVVSSAPHPNFDYEKKEWKKDGYNQEEVDMLLEAYALECVKDKETWQEDKKRRKLLRKQALESKIKRLS